MKKPLRWGGFFCLPAGVLVNPPGPLCKGGKPTGRGIPKTRLALIYFKHLFLFRYNLLHDISGNSFEISTDFSVSNPNDC